MRYYSTPLGRLPSVTSILSVTMPVDRRAKLDEWVQSSGALKKQDEGRSRGNALDAWAKAYLLSKPLPLDHRYARHARWLGVYLDYVKRSAAAIACDVVVYSDLGYAGTVDVLWRNQAGFWIVEDIKTCTRRIHPQSVGEAQLQAIAYATALREMGYSVAAIAPVYVTPTECKTFLTNDPLALDALFLKWMARLTQFRQARYDVS